MSSAILSQIAQKVISGNLPLSIVRDILGVEIAVKVHELTISRPFQPVKWVRRIR